VRAFEGTVARPSQLEEMEPRLLGALEACETGRPREEFALASLLSSTVERYQGWEP